MCHNSFYSLINYFGCRLILFKLLASAVIPVLVLSSVPVGRFYATDDCKERMMIQTLSLARGPLHSLSYWKTPDSIPTVFNFQFRHGHFVH